MAGEKATQTRGMFWHIHHELLCEWSDDINERIAYIKTYKPSHEVSIRLQWLTPVKGVLPPDLAKANADFAKARADYRKASDDYAKARADYDKASDDYAKARADYDKARAALDKASDDFAKARADYDKASDDFAKARADYDKASDDFDKARADYDKARAAYRKASAAHKPELEALHAIEHPGCPWDGRTLFPGKGV